MSFKVYPCFKLLSIVDNLFYIYIRTLCNSNGKNKFVFTKGACILLIYTHLFCSSSQWRTFGRFLCLYFLASFPHYRLQKLDHQLDAFQGPRCQRAPELKAHYFLTLQEKSILTSICGRAPSKVDTPLLVTLSFGPRSPHYMPPKSH